MADSVTYTNNTNKGKYRPENPQKYVGDRAKIVFRSSYELRFMRYCDINSNILQWSSEETVINYVNPFDHTTHRYFVDFWVKLRNTKGEIKKYIVETKPDRYTREPEIPKKRTRQFLNEVVQWKINEAKWEAARKWATVNDCSFILITENDLGLLTVPMTPFRNKPVDTLHH